jgi:hypothetical protein
MRTGQFRHQVSRDLRAVGKGFVPKLRQLRDDVAQLGVADIKLGVIGPQMRPDRLGEFRFVVAFLVEADRKGVHGPVGQMRHQGHDRRGIDPARQERAEGHVRHHLLSHGPEQQGFEFLDRGLGGDVAARGLRGDGGPVPVAMPPRFGLPVRDLDHLARLHPAEPAVDRQVLADIAVAQELHERRALDLALEGGVPAQGGQFRAEQEGPVRTRTLPAEIERLFPDPVADQCEDTLLTVQTAMANMPTARAIVGSMPQASKPATRVSVSECPRQAGALPLSSSSARRSRWL